MELNFIFPLTSGKSTERERNASKKREGKKKDREDKDLSLLCTFEYDHDKPILFHNIFSAIKASLP